MSIILIDTDMFEGANAYNTGALLRLVIHHHRFGGEEPFDEYVKSIRRTRSRHELAKIVGLSGFKLTDFLHRLSATALTSSAVGRKWCTRCKSEKPIAKFSKNEKHPDRKQTYCKKCQAEYQQEWEPKKRRKR